MHPNYFSRVRRLSSVSANSVLVKGVLVAALFCCSIHQAPAVTVYWDINGTTTGSGNAGGTWDNNTTSDWTNNSLGTSATNTWNSFGASSIATFSAGSDGTGTFTVATNGAINNVGGLTFTSGNVTVGGSGTLNLSQNATVTTTANGTISAIVAGAFNLTKAGAGTLVLSGTDTYTGVTTISAGTLQIGNGAAAGSITSSVNIVDNGSLVFDSSSNVSYSAVISGTGTITQNGSGTITLSSAGNSESGIINLNAGTISVVGAGHLGATPGAVVANYLNFNGGTLELTTNGGVFGAQRGVTLNAGGGTWQSDVTGIPNQLFGVVTGSGNFTKTGAGTLEFDGLNTNTGATIVSAGTLQLGIANATSNTSALTVASGATFSLANATTGFAGAVGSIAGAGNITMGIAGSALTIGNDNTSTTFSGVISGVGSLTKVGTGTETLSGTNTYTGATTINAGTLSIGTDNNLGTAPVAVTANDLNFGGGTLQTTGTFALSSNRGVTLNAGGGTIDTTSGTTLTYGGIVAGTGALTKTDTGTLTLSGTNTYTGATTINAGTLSIGTDNNLGTAPVAVTANDLNFGGGTLQTTGTFALSSNRGVTLNAGGGTIDTTSGTTLTYGGIVAGTGALTKTDTGTLTLSGANTFTGGLNLNAGTVKVTANTNLGGAANNLTFNGGTLEVAGITSTARTLTVGAGSTGTLQIDSGNVFTLGTGSVLSAGNASSVLTVNGINSTGTLQLGANQTFSGTLDLSNAKLSLAGFNLTVGTLDIIANSVIDFGGSSSSSILSMTNLILGAGVTLTVNNWNDEKEYFYSANTPTGSLTQISWGAPYTGDTTKWLSYTDGPGPGHEITPVPEPSTYGAIFTAAALGLFFWFRLKANAPRPVPVRVAVRH